MKTVMERTDGRESRICGATAFQLATPFVHGSAAVTTVARETYIGADGENEVSLITNRS
jgi:hypothetical protein